MSRQVQHLAGLPLGRRRSIERLREETVRESHQSQGRGRGGVQVERRGHVAVERRGHVAVQRPGHVAVERRGHVVVERRGHVAVHCSKTFKPQFRCNSKRLSFVVCCIYIKYSL